LSFPIIGIGASAGGLEALTELLGALPSKSGMAIIVVLHLDPDRESLVSQILAKRTALTIVEARDGLAIEQDNLYLIPPNATLTVSNGKLKLTQRPPAPARHLPVDALFRSLAEAHPDRTITVVLSGGDADGALGSQAVKHEGGITFAQDPTSARVPSMPASAIATDSIDFVLRPNQIAYELLRLVRHPYLRSAPASDVKSVEPDNTDPEPTDESSLRRIFRRLRSAHDIDFSHYKRSTLRRRLARRMALQKIDSLVDYVALVESDATEAATLHQDFLIRVTGFFRDSASFDVLRETVFPRLCEDRSTKDPIRIWVPGCATGEEAYSIAISLVEFLGDHSPPEALQIFGTDVSSSAIDKARAGHYPRSISEEVSGERLKRFFVQRDDHYQISKTIRDRCIFARQDVTRDPPFSRLSLVSCRNLLIYLDSAAQRRVMQVFHYSLLPHGFLVLGPSETVGQTSDLFELADKQHRVYTRKSTPPGGTFHNTQRPASASERFRNADPDEAPALLDVASAEREADRVLISRFAPASLLIDDSLNILQFRGETGRYLEHASGASSLNLNRVVRPELLVEIAPAIQEARASGSTIRRERLSVRDDENIAVEIIPLMRESSPHCYLIVFDDGRSGARREAVPSATLTESEKDRRISQVERENASLRDFMQATMEQHEAFKEELRSAHEEVLSANEEFQSTNEELETAKEELQSANEELTTTNDELRDRHRAQAALNAEVERSRRHSERARAYADAIIEAVQEPLVVLDARFTVLRANRSFYAKFQVSAEDTETQSFFQLGNRQWDMPEVHQTLDSVLAEIEPVASAEIFKVFPVLGERVMSVGAHKIAGNSERDELILVSLEDVTDRHARAKSLQDSSARKDEFLAMLAHELRNPLTAITNATHVLQHADVSDSVKKLHGIIARQTGRLTRLVDELLDVARISRGLIELKLSAVDLAIIVQLAAEASADRVEQMRHQLTLDLPSDPVYVNGDPVRLEQVVTNLLENAIKYTPPGGQIVLKVSSYREKVELSVRDTGIGLAPNMLQGAFEAFTQADSSLERSQGGLGLGLTVVRRITELHGGTIEARSEGLGKGSEFIVCLPLTSAATQPRSQGNGVTASFSAGPARQGRRLMIVDDNTDSAESMQLLARSWGYEVVIANDGPSAIELARRFNPHVALLDIGLPGLDGYTVARQLHADPAHSQLRLIALSGYGREEDRALARQAGFEVHLIKPVDITRLQRLLADRSDDASSSS
jgi:two-component system CheB/CheR fusion protein